MIACLGWGSLTWNPDGLPVEGDWYTGGLHLPVEFNRVSSDGRLTLVITEGTPPVAVLWSYLSVSSLDDGIQALAKREGISRSGVGQSIGVWSTAYSSRHAEAATIGEWAEQRDLTAVVWTALKPGFRESRGKPLTCRDALIYLRSLEGKGRARAEEYIRRAPVSVRTPYRTAIEHEFGWTAA